MLGRLHSETAQRYKGQPTEPQPLSISVISAQAPDLRATNWPSGHSSPSRHLVAVGGGTLSENRLAELRRAADPPEITLRWYCFK